MNLNGILYPLLLTFIMALLASAHALPEGGCIVRNSILLFIVLLGTGISVSAETTGNDVLKHCQTAIRFSDNNGAPTGEHFESGWCIGWVNSVLQLTKLHNEWTDFTKQKPTLLQFCVPTSGIPIIQAVRIVVKYLKDHPEQLHEDGMGLTIAALKDSFPCGGKS